ncbi:lanthionine synthetase C family protein [Yinghuangia sp. YIM S10712]|uniref:lanthionine synthetase C family protein n=1 Tax=Yinghuangia sp. YIM S10712 TaxID=3436930 RepID=UPI003F53D068
MTPDEALAVADRFADPADSRLPSDAAWWRQSLARGVPGVALLHTEAAAADLRPWSRVHVWLQAAGSNLSGGAGTGAFYGAPAIAHAAACVAMVDASAYRDALTFLDERIATHAIQRVKDANARFALRELPELAEFDTIRGLAGVGRYLLRRSPDSPEMAEVLSYLVRLTHPLEDDRGPVPGWWTRTGPNGRYDHCFPGGHGNAGMAHGIGGALALLSLATLRDVKVPGQGQAIADICGWLDNHRLRLKHGARWPYMVDRIEHMAGTTPVALQHHGAYRRPSWCYGTAGLARAQQLAALATGDVSRRRTAEAAMLGALRDPAQRNAVTDDSLCHGTAGLARIAARMADHAEPHTAAELRAQIPPLLEAAVVPANPDPGWLEGHTGTALATLSPYGPPATEWDTCLLVA